MSFEQPLLWLGLAGFTPEQRQRLNVLLGRLPRGWPSWRHGAFAEADAWLVCGEKCRLLSADTLKILAGLPTERTVQLNLDEVDRPIAFSLPLASSDLDPMHAFDLASDAGLQQVLQRFEEWLRPLRAQFVLGGQLISRESELLPGIYHVSHKGALLAVMDFHEWRIGIAPGVDPVDLELARWHRRPLEAHDIPPHFLLSNLSQLRWIYAQRTERDVLPPRYRSKPVYFRHAPAVPQRWLKDSQLLLLRELSVGPANLDTLQRRTRLAPAQLTRDLASLYFAGSVTTTPDKAGAGGFTADDASMPLKGANGAAKSAATASASLPERPHFSPMAVDLTAPAQLKIK